MLKNCYSASVKAHQLARDEEGLSIGQVDLANQRVGQSDSCKCSYIEVLCSLAVLHQALCTLAQQSVIAKCTDAGNHELPAVSDESCIAVMVRSS